MFERLRKAGGLVNQSVTLIKSLQRGMRYVEAALETFEFGKQKFDAIKAADAGDSPTPTAAPVVVGTDNTDDEADPR